MTKYHSILLVFYEKIMNFLMNGIELLKFEGLASKSDIFYINMRIWTKIGVKVVICLGNNQDNFQLQRFTTSEICKKLWEATFLTQTVYRLPSRIVSYLPHRYRFLRYIVTPNFCSRGSIFLLLDSNAGNKKIFIYDRTD